MKGMCSAAEAALPGCQQEKRNSGGKPGSMHRSVYLSVPMALAGQDGGAIADPGGILVELGQSGGNQPTERRPVTSLLSRQLADAGIQVAQFTDLAPFDVLMLHPGRTLIEKLLRVNNFALDETRRSIHGWPRIGRQLYDIWALLGDSQVCDFLADHGQASEVLADCIRISEDFMPDLAPPVGGFGACRAFDPDWEHSARLREEHDTAMLDLYYGLTPAPTYDDVIARVHDKAELLDLGT